MNASKYYLMMSGVAELSIMNASKYSLMILVKLSVHISNDTFKYFSMLSGLAILSIVNECFQMFLHVD